MKLTKATDVLARLSKDSTRADNIALAESVLEAATIAIESILFTELESNTYIDYYDYSPSRFDLQNKPLVFNLGNMFLDGPIIVYSSANNIAVDVTDPLTIVSSSKYDLFKDNGIVHLNLIPKTGKNTIAVKYSSGFVDEDTNIPNWLKQVAISSAISIFHIQPPGHSKRDQIILSSELRSIVYDQVKNRIRPKYEGLWPDSSVLV